MIKALLSTIAPAAGPVGVLINSPGDLGRHDLEAWRINAEARLRRYGLGHLRVALSGRTAAPFSVSGGTTAQQATALKLLAD